MLRTSDEGGRGSVRSCLQQDAAGVPGKQIGPAFFLLGASKVDAEGWRRCAFLDTTFGVKPVTDVQIHLRFVEPLGVPAERNQGIREAAEDWVEVDYRSRAGI
jgi:hypothetical protein